MPDSAETQSFIRSSFRSVWALELLCLLKQEAGRSFMRGELVERLRASDLVVRQSIQSLEAAGLVVSDETGSARYSPANSDLDRLASATEILYGRRPDFVRRLIVLSGQDQLAAFSNAFRFRKD